MTYPQLLWGIALHFLTFVKIIGIYKIMDDNSESIKKGCHGHMKLSEISIAIECVAKSLLYKNFKELL